MRKETDDESLGGPANNEGTECIPRSRQRVSNTIPLVTYILDPCWRTWPVHGPSHCCVGQSCLLRRRHVPQFAVAFFLRDCVGTKCLDCRSGLQRSDFSEATVRQRLVLPIAAVVRRRGICGRRAPLRLPPQHHPRQRWPRIVSRSRLTWWRGRSINQSSVGSFS